jgi:hypothetical protein
MFVNTITDKHTSIIERGDNAFFVFTTMAFINHSSSNIVVNRIDHDSLFLAGLLVKHGIISAYGRLFHLTPARLLWRGLALVIHPVHAIDGIAIFLDPLSLWTIYDCWMWSAAPSATFYDHHAFVSPSEASDCSRNRLSK